MKTKPLLHRTSNVFYKIVGYTIPAVVASGEEAVKQAGETHPDLVLMDIQLKGAMDGMEAA